MLGAVLAPAVTHARAAGDGPWSELCSASSMKADPMDGATPSHAEHCALCAQLHAAPLPEVPDLPVVHAVHALGIPATASTFARLPWRAAQPRGPPATTC